MEKGIIDIIKSKKFYELNSSEKKELSEYCSSEDEFNQLKQAFIAVDATTFPSVAPQAKTKKRLDDLFVQTYPQAAPIWYNTVLAVIVPKEKPIYKQPLMQVAAVIVLLFLAVPFFNTKFDLDKELIAENKVEVKGNEKVEADVVNYEIDVDKVIAEELERKQVEISEIPVEEKLPISSPTGWVEISNDLIEDNVAIIANDIFASPNDSELAFDHPDGVFEETTVLSTSALSISAADSEDLMDLLVATF